jgi:hypothetical protein
MAYVVIKNLSGCLNYSKYQLDAFVIDDNFYAMLSVLNVGAVLRQATTDSVCSATRLKEN